VGEGPTVMSLHDAFVASPGHYHNIVNPNFTHMGVGVVLTPEGRIWVSFVFGG
jgi:uncharacterized protein YkwD